ncbi:hypothetical protein [Rhodohalobacter sp. 8-1]|uniref:hypothetical protein n=1 Tax=Rhodohalobacter sp. 8-1 TaxID=3131972 RepID=UPI0030EE42BF
METQTLNKYIWKAQWGIVFSLTLLSSCTVSSDSQEWNTYRYDGEIVFTLEYPAQWTTTQKEQHVVLFTPPDNGDVIIEIVVYDPVETPPLPVHITYDTLRVVDSRLGPISVLKRDPAAVTERYVAFIDINSHIAEFRLYAKSDYDEIFDHMLATTRPITSQN